MLDERVIEFLNQQMKTVQVFGLEVRCFGEEPNTVVVPYLIGQTQATATKISSSGRSRNWTIAELRAAYAELTDPLLSNRLLALLDWAVQRTFAEPGKDTQNPVFVLIGHTGKQIVSVAPRWIDPLLQQERFANPDERNTFVTDLKNIGLYPPDFDPASTKAGKNTRRLEEWSDAQFSAFLDTLLKYCGPRTSAASTS